ncbi:sulfurtransferase [Chloroflexi bacterium TSY]|nr:sulfurtransferase [Chloroflexi bacterium TSY]
MKEAFDIPSLLVEPTWLVEHLFDPQLVLLDVRLYDSYTEGHLPGALWVDLHTLSTEVDGIEGMLLPPAQFAARLGIWGIQQDSRVVLYDDNWGMPAARVLWGFTRFGHSHLAVLNGGWDRWIEEGHPQTQTIPNTTPSNYQIVADDAQIAEYAWLLHHLDDPNIVVIDTRSAVEYQQGHLPGAIWWDWMNGVPVDGWNAVRSSDELLTELATLGITPEKEIVTYCRSGARAAHTYLLLRYLGFLHVRNYDGSWLEWSKYFSGMA